MTIIERERTTTRQEELSEQERVWVETVLNWKDPTPFEKVYPDVGNNGDRDLIQKKCAVARALIKDGSYPHQVMLAKKFIPPKIEVMPDLVKMRDKLYLDLILYGRISPESKEAEEAQEEVIRFVNNDESLKALSNVLPIHVMGVVTNTLFFDNISDDQKRSELRSWTSRSLLRPYLGNIAVRRTAGNIDLRQLFPLVPDRVFADADLVSSRIIEHYFFRSTMGLFASGEAEGFEALRRLIDSEKSNVKKKFLEKVNRRFQEIAKVEVPSRYKTEVDWVEGLEDLHLPFPSLMQKYIMHEFAQTRRKLLKGGTGAAKTSTAYLLMDTVNAERVTVFGQAQARDTWPAEAKSICKEGMAQTVFTIQSRKDLDDPRVETADFVYMGSEMMAEACNDPIFARKLVEAFVFRRKTDGVILEESDTFTETSQASRVLVDLVLKIREQYEERERNVFGEPKIIPILALTATPVTSSTKDMDICMWLLYPERFSLPGESRQDKNGRQLLAFSEQTLNNPLIAHSVLFGENLIIEWDTRDNLGDMAQLFELGPETRKYLPISPSQYTIYEWIVTFPLSNFSKVRLLRDVLLNPEMVKKSCWELERKARSLPPDHPLAQFEYIPDFKYKSRQELIDRFIELHDAWMQWAAETRPSQIPHEPFNIDWIAKYGDRDFVLQCFLDDRLVFGADSLVDSIARDFPLIAEDWQRNETISAKCQALRELIIERAKTGKVFIVSPHHKHGITRDFQDEDSSLEDDFFSLFELIKYDWLNGVIPPEQVVSVDGDMSFKERDRVAREFRKYGDRARVVVGVMDAIYRSKDWAVRNTPETADVDSVTVIYLDWPWVWKKFEQMNGRFFRPGLSKPVNLRVYETVGTISEGLFQNVYYDYLITQLMFAGVSLSTEQKEFLDRARSGKGILVYQPREGQVFIQDAVRRLRGLGEDGIAGELSKKTNKNEGETYYDFWAQAYFENGNDEYRAAGNNAQLVSNIVAGYKPRRVLSVGAGTCLFARKMANIVDELPEIDNLDINGAVLRLAKQRFPDIVKNTIIGRASELADDKKNLEAGRSNYYDAVECSLMLDLAKCAQERGSGVEETERVKDLIGMNKVLRDGGIAVVSLPDSIMDDNRFGRFIQAMPYFGFVVQDSSGRAFATDRKPPRSISWIMTLKKVRQPRLDGLSVGDLMFLSDYEVIVRKSKSRRSSGVIKVEFPLFASKEFEIRNPLTGGVRNFSGLRVSVEATPEDVSRYRQDLRGLSEDSKERKIWIRCLRRIQKEFNVSYEEALYELVKICENRALRYPTKWIDKGLENVSGIINSELNRKLRKTSEGNGGTK